MCFKLLDNLHTKLDNRIKNLKIRLRDDNYCESANIIGRNCCLTCTHARK
jgi:hypothetical protein